MTISEFTVTSSNTNKWASVKTSAVGGDAKYGIYVTTGTNPRYTFQNSSFYPADTKGSIAIVELYANSEGGSGSGDPNDGIAVGDGVALTNTYANSIPKSSLSSNTAVYGVDSITKKANYVYNFTNNGYANSKIMAIGGNKNRRVFAIRSWGEEPNVNYNMPYIAFIGDNNDLEYNGTGSSYSVGCVGATRTTSANTWVSHNAGDGTKYYSITNTTTNVNAYKSLYLVAGHTYRFTLHAHTETSWDGVAICKTTTTSSFKALTADQLLSGDISTGKCSGSDKTTTFEYTVGSAGSLQIYIYFKSDGSGIGPGDSKSFADVMIEDLGDLRAEQTTPPTAVDVSVERGNTATASATGSGYGDLQYRVLSSTGSWGSWTTAVPTRTDVGITWYQARYAGDNSYKPSPASNDARLEVTPTKITKPTAATGLSYGDEVYIDMGVIYADELCGINNMPSEYDPVLREGTEYATLPGNYSVTYTLTATDKFCWSDKTTDPVTVNWSIARREVNLIWGTTSWTYDGTEHSTTCTIGGLLGDDICSVILDGNSITDVGSTTVAATSLSNIYYRLPSKNTTTLTVKPCMYFKKAGSWVPVKEVYKKVNGSWVKQTTTIGNTFSTSGKYLGRYHNGSTWENLIDENS